jgi:carboxypeptidase family protein
MRRIPAIVLLVAGLLGVSLTGCVNPNAIGVQTYGTVVGVVVDAQTQKPIGGALVWIGSTTNARTTDSNGGFVIPNIPEGTQTVHVTAGGYQSFTQDIQVVQGNNPALPPISLQPV